MSKSADAFRTISEVAEWLDTPAHVLRFWESKFTQVKPVKRAGGRRYYRPADMRLLGGIKKLLHEDGMTIKGAQKVLREQGIKHVSSLCELSLGDEDEAGMAEMQDMAVSEPVDTVVPFSKPETDGEPIASDTAADSEPERDTVLSQDTPVEADAERDAAPAEPEPVAPYDTDGLDETAPQEMGEATVEEDDPVTEQSVAASASEPIPEPAEIVAKTDTQLQVPSVEIALPDTSSLPGFLQHSMEERSAEDHSEAESHRPAESQPMQTEPEEPMPVVLTHLSKITHLPPELAQRIAPVLDRLREVAR